MSMAGCAGSGYAALLMAERCADSFAFPSIRTMADQKPTHAAPTALSATAMMPEYHPYLGQVSASFEEVRGEVADLVREAVARLPKQALVDFMADSGWGHWRIPLRATGAHTPEVPDPRLKGWAIWMYHGRFDRVAYTVQGDKGFVVPIPEDIR